MAPRKNKASKPVAANTVPDSDHIVFAKDGAKERVKKDGESEGQAAPPRPDARKIIGGASWTGKLPMTLLSEICQKQKWNKPDYSMRKMPDASGGGYRSSVKLSKTDPKTKGTITLSSFQLPDSHVHIADQPTALEARHFAAAYALFRVSSMKNIHMMLPPQFRDLWKGEFTQLKESDVKENRAWKYDADPFAAEAKRQEILAGMEKKKAERAKQEAATNSVGMVVTSRPAGVTARVWERAPKVEMGRQIRTDIEDLIRQSAIWNPYGVLLSSAERVRITTDLVRLGFRESHVQEAVQYCKDREETLEWLLVHVPEDDLPSWCLPAGYSSGVSFVSGDLAKEAKLKRLALAGYPTELCAKMLQDTNGDEDAAAEALQESLVPSEEQPEVGSEVEEVWRDEMTTLEAIFDDKFTQTSPTRCSIRIQSPTRQASSVQFRKPHNGYPMSAAPVISIEAEQIPAYIRLSATRQAVLFARKTLLGDSMIFGIVEWLETNIPRITEHPGSLLDLFRPGNLRTGANASSLPGLSNTETPTRRKHVLRTSKTLSLADEEIRSTWEARLRTPAQRKMTKARQSLPAWSKQQAIVEAVHKHQCVIISGETGSGKSTQSVQFILDHLISSLQGSSANILCTQPRRISALGLSDRVSAERCSPEGKEVGYIIRGDSKVSSSTKITFMTTGVLLRRLQSSPDFDTALAEVSHIFVDEVHERSLDTDFLLALIRDALKARKDLKLILMSATLDAKIFLDYFGGASKVGQVHIEGRTFPVTDYYLDDVVRITKSGGRSLPQDGEEEDSLDFDTGKAIMSLGAGINYNLIADLVRHIDNQLGREDGGILIFLPGTFEIDRCLGALRNSPGLHALPLHASLTPMEQRRVFPPAPLGKRKVIACTNVAETSITIEDIVAVIDTGRVKETNYNAADNIVRLEEVWASQAACKQRRGRAGRVRAGFCWKLFTRNVEANAPARPEPEIRRVPLEQLCLSVKATGSDRDVAQFLAETLTPPDRGAVSTAMKLLHRMGALDNDRLTALGTYLSMIPADLRCAKLLVYGSVFSCLDACLTVASILTVRSVFVSPRDKREEAREARSSFPRAHGDLLLDMAAYNNWDEQSQSLSYRDLQDWCSSKFLSQQTLRDIRSTRSQLLNSLTDAGIVPLEYGHGQSSASRSSLNACQGDKSLLRALLAGALNPQLAQIEFPDKKFIASMSGAKELDPEARTIKYFNQENGRVFVHPSSVLFDAQTFSGSAAFISYFSKMATSKTFIRDLTPFNAYGLLLFGGSIEVDTSGNGLLVDGWIRLRGWARVGVLVSRLRMLLDDALRQRIDHPGMPVEEGGVFGIVRRLVEFNGQDQ